MLCPECREDMLILEYDNIEIDYCDECSGIWLDEGELELLLGSSPDVESPVVMALTGGAPTLRGTGRGCPVCGRKMVLVDIELTSGEPAGCVEIDKCPKNHGLWFDNGELQQIISASKGEPVSDFLADLFSSG